MPLLIIGVLGMATLWWVTIEEPARKIRQERDDLAKRGQNSLNTN